MTDSVVHFPSLRRILSDLWPPLGGVSITNNGRRGMLLFFIGWGKVKILTSPFSLYRFLGSSSQSPDWGSFGGTGTKLGHGEGFCPLRMTIVVHVVEFGWDASLRAPSRREAMMSRKWLQENCSGINQAGGNSFHMDVDGRGEGKSFSDIQIVNPYLNSWSRDGVMTR
ncbi:hypothetical protein Godav_008985 [Gossypium davidsonii]|uniref:Uncharacterized protein n=1 Tax=Gossypium davidsonii TaxID=34287 RepID=A0A7J8SBP2_GOSDV|nr:hypothetical protein [Gossypium davidsonii]